jgi:hypothetical protein
MKFKQCLFSAHANEPGKLSDRYAMTVLQDLKMNNLQLKLLSVMKPHSVNQEILIDMT